MRPMITVRDVAQFAPVHDWMRDNYTRAWFCLEDCGMCLPYLGTQFEVLEDLEYPANCHETKVLPQGRYEAIGQDAGGTSHQVRLLDLDTGREIYLTYGYEAQHMIDWRGTREIAAPKY